MKWKAVAEIVKRVATATVTTLSPEIAERSPRDRRSLRTWGTLQENLRYSLIKMAVKLPEIIRDFRPELS